MAQLTIAVVVGSLRRDSLNAKLADGIVKNVTSEGLVFIQDINDPLSVQKQREVRKLLRSLEDAKE